MAFKQFLLQRLNTQLPGYLSEDLQCTSVAGYIYIYIYIYVTSTLESCKNTLQHVTTSVPTKNEVHIVNATCFP